MRRSLIVVLSFVLVATVAARAFRPAIGGGAPKGGGNSAPQAALKGCATFAREAALRGCATEAGAAAVIGRATADASTAAWRAQAPPRRVVSLIPAVTEMIFAIGEGARLVGVSAYD